MTDEELSISDATLIARLRNGCNLQQRDGERAADRIEALTKERDQHWDSFVHWRKQADDLTGQLAAAAQADYDARILAAIREAALLEAHDAIADYPRVAPDATEAHHYDEQIEYCQSIILALITEKPHDRA